MSRQLSRYQSGPGLKRQHSMRTDEMRPLERLPIEYYDSRSNSAQRGHSGYVKSHELHVIPDSQNHRRTPEHSYINHVINNSNPNTTIMNVGGNSGSANAVKSSISSRYLNVLDPNLSAHSSLRAMSRVSQQPSFESYDSSMSTTSWASSNEPDGTYALNKYSNDKRSISSQNVTSPTYPSSPNFNNNNNTNTTTTNNNTKIKSSILTGNTHINNNNNNKILKSDEQETITNEDQSNNNSKSINRMIKSKDKINYFKRNPLLRSMTTDVASERSNNVNHSNSLRNLQTSDKDKFEQHSLNFKNIYKTLSNEISDLKIIGMKKENPADLKSNTSSGAQNIKGLWKRAFHSLRKDKNERDSSLGKRKEGGLSNESQNSEGEIDPVYHLLRCAASKSQSTALATTGINTSKINNKTSNTNFNENVQSFRSEIYSTNEFTFPNTKKKYSNVTFKSDDYNIDYLTENKQFDNNNMITIASGGAISGVLGSGASSSSSNISSHSTNNIISNEIIRNLSIPSLNEEQRLAQLDEAELAYEQHKRMNTRQKALRIAHNSPSIMSEDNNLQSEINKDWDKQATQTGREINKHFNTMNPASPININNNSNIHNSRKFHNPNFKTSITEFRNSNEIQTLYGRRKSISFEEHSDNHYLERNPYKQYPILDNMNNPHYQTNPNSKQTSLHYFPTTATLINSNNLNPNIKTINMTPICGGNLSNYEEMNESNNQIMENENRLKKVPLLSTKSFSLDVPRYDQLCDSMPNASGGSSPGRYSERAAISSILKTSQGLQSGSSLSPISLHQNDPLICTRTHKMSALEEPHTHELSHSSQMIVKDNYINENTFGNLDDYHKNYTQQFHSSELNVGLTNRRKFSPARVYPTGSRTTSSITPVNRILPKPIENNGERYIVKRNFMATQRNELNLRTGFYVDVIEMTDPMWWYGVHDGKMGYFPSSYIQKYLPGNENRFQ